MECNLISCFWIQYSIVFLSFFVLTKIICPFNWFIIEIGTLIVFTLLSWHITKYIRRNFINKNEWITSHGKAVLITGCDSGFGNRLAHKLNAHGYTVYAACLNPSGPGPLNLLKNTRFTNKTKLIKLNVTDEQEIDDAYAEISADLTKNNEQLWALVNNAGIVGVTPFIESGSIDSYKKIFDVNTFGTVRMTRAFLPLIRKSKGRIVNVVSIAGRFTFQRLTSYSMSKFALTSYSDALRRDMIQWGVKVSTIEPITYKTPIVDSMMASFDKQWNETAPNIQEEYGIELYNETKQIFQYASRLARENIDEVIDDMIHAVRNVEPEYRYAPGDVLTKLKYDLYQYLPTELYESIFMNITKERTQLLKN